MRSTNGFVRVSRSHPLFKEPEFKNVVCALRVENPNSMEVIDMSDEDTGDLASDYDDMGEHEAAEWVRDDD